MIEANDLKLLIEEGIEGCSVEIEDMTGAKDHYRVVVTSNGFSGLALIDQHRLVQATVQPAYDDGRLHALSIKTIAATDS